MFFDEDCYLVTSFYRQFIWERFKPLEEDAMEELW